MCVCSVCGGLLGGVCLVVSVLEVWCVCWCDLVCLRRRLVFVMIGRIGLGFVIVDSRHHDDVFCVLGARRIRS